MNPSEKNKNADFIIKGYASTTMISDLDNTHGIAM